MDHPVSDELHANPSLPVLPQPNINPNLLSVDCRQEPVVQLFFFLCDVVSFFFSSFLVFVVVVHFFKGVLYRIMCDFCVWLGLKTLAW